MRNHIISICFLLFLSNNIFSQSIIHNNGGCFLKTFEYNILAEGNPPSYNLHSKTTLDRIFFGNTNSFVEYIYHTSLMEVRVVVLLKIERTIHIKLR